MVLILLLSLFFDREIKSSFNSFVYNWIFEYSTSAINSFGS